MKPSQLLHSLHLLHPRHSRQPIQSSVRTPVLNHGGRFREVLFLFLIIMLVLSALYGLIVVGKYIGFATSHAGEAGYIYPIVIIHKQDAEVNWAGVYGVAVRVDGYNNQQYEEIVPNDLVEKNLLFNCMEPKIDHEVYASVAGPTEIDWSTLYPASPAEVDAWLGKDTSDSDSATNTYIHSVTVEFGTTTITMPGTYTHKIDESLPSTFSTGILKDSQGNLIFTARTVNFTEGFNGRVFNYQMILPVPSNTSKTYYFYTDPNDICLVGEDEAPTQGLIMGNVTDVLGNRLGEVIVDVAGSSDFTDSVGFYNISTQHGSHRIYAIKTGYEVYWANVTVTANNISYYNIVMTPSQVPNPNTGTGPGQDEPGDATGVGPGEAKAQEAGIPPVPYIEQPAQIEGTDFVVSLNDLRRKISLGSFLQESIYVFSFKKTPITATFKIEGNASDLIEFDQETIVIQPNENENVVLTIFGKGPPGIYNGSLIIDGDINASVPVEIEVMDQAKLPIESLVLDLETAQKEVLPGDNLKFKTDLRNLLIEHPYGVNLFYTVQHEDGGEVVWSYDTNIYLKTAQSIIKTFKLPNNLKPGDYILRATASYLGISSGTSTIFRVNVPFWQRYVLGLRMWMWILILLFIGLAIGGYIWWSRVQEAKKKFHLKVELSEIPGPGPRSIYVGKIAETDHKTYFNLEKFKVHTIVAGSTGGGKSVSAQVIIEEALDKGVAVIAFDPTAQWTGMLRPCKDKTMLSLYPFFGMKKTAAKAYSGNVRMILDAREKIDVMKFVKPGEIQVFCFHKLDPKDMDIVVANAIRSIFRSGPDESKPLKVMFVFDEVHRLLPKFGGSGDGFLQIERACREFRKWGLGVLLISQVLSDFVGTIKANINTEIQMRTRDEGDLERIRQKYGEDVLRSLVKATVGSGMVENPAYNRGRPYFVAFRPLKHSVERMGDEEIQKYNDYNDKVDNLVYSLEQLEQEGVDVFDLKLELKLALDKVKSGNFNMVDVYLEGLTPRVDELWHKLGKKPKKYERELVDLAELKQDIAKAREERDKYVAGQEAKKGAEGGGEEKREMGWSDDVPPDKLLSLTNGMVVINLASLYDEISAMKDEDFAIHVTEEKNDFAKWVMDAIGDTKLAYNLYATTDKAKMLEVLQLKKDGKDLPDAKPPAYLTKQQAAPAASAAPAAPAAPAAEGQAAPAAAPAQPAQTSTPEAALAPAAQQDALGEMEKAPDETPPEQQSENYVYKPKPGEQPAQSQGAQSQGAQSQGAQSQGEQSQREQPVPTPPQPQQPPAEQQPAPAPQPEAAPPPAPEATPAPEQQPAPAPQPEAAPPPEAAPAPQPEQPPAEQQPAPAASLTTPEAAPPASVPAPTLAVNLDALMTSDPNQYFHLENGVDLKGMKDLKEYLGQMDEGIFNNHVGQDYNHFADWVNGVFQNQQIADKLRGAHTKQEMASVLEELAGGAAPAG